MELLTESINNFQSLTIFPKGFILDTCQGPKCARETCKVLSHLCTNGKIGFHQTVKV